MALAPAKINLYLHVCGRRADGYHLLDSLMVPLAFGDVLEMKPHQELKLEVKGNRLLGKKAEHNLVMKAAHKLQAALKVVQGANITLQKKIPVAAGLGGGSSDAATTLKLLLSLWQKNMPQEQLLKLAESLGADVPFFLAAKPQYVEGIGEQLTEVTLPKLYILLVNPGVPISTAEIFAKGFAAYNAPAVKQSGFPDIQTLIEYLKPLSNDLTQHAIKLAPVIGQLITQMEKAPGCMLARMSGSGATCFGIFRDAEFCAAAAAQFAPRYWAEATHTL